jgi:hypothetical protein
VAVTFSPGGTRSLDGSGAGGQFLQGADFDLVSVKATGTDGWRQVPLAIFLEISRFLKGCRGVEARLRRRFGAFNEERNGTSADWAFRLHCAHMGKRLLFVESAVGRYLVNPNSHNRRNETPGVKEAAIIRDVVVEIKSRL